MPTFMNSPSLPLLDKFDILKVDTPVCCSSKYLPIEVATLKAEAQAIGRQCCQKKLLGNVSLWSLIRSSSVEAGAFPIKKGIGN
ncbi:hypothetical protein AB3S75_010646 [Citrus x aurantiifolia]